MTPKQRNPLVYPELFEASNKRDVLTSQVRSYQCVTARRPAAGSTFAGIFYECWVADHHRACTDSNMDCSPWFNDDNAILAHL